MLLLLDACEFSSCNVQLKSRLSHGEQFHGRLLAQVIVPALLGLPAASHVLGKEPLAAEHRQPTDYFPRDT